MSDEIAVHANFVLRMAERLANNSFTVDWLKPGDGRGNDDMLRWLREKTDTLATMMRGQSPPNRIEIECLDLAILAMMLEFKYRGTWGVQEA
jgi:hypothetical protein